MRLFTYSLPMSAGGFITGTKKFTQRCGARAQPAVGGAGAGALHSRKMMEK
jgi:hypothetical protein